MTADTECAAAIGMLAKLYGLPVPQRQEQLTQMRETLKQQIRDLSSTEQMDRLFRRSRLMRSKWDRVQSGSTYGALTLEKAVAQHTEK